MRTPRAARLWGALVLAALAVAPGTGQAANDAYDPFSGYGSHSARVGLTGGLLTGTLPPASGGGQYVQQSLGAEFNALLFSEPTVFGTLLGIEFDAVLGGRVVDRPPGAVDSEGDTEGIKPVFKMDFEFAYDLVRWKLFALRQRLILNAGGGFDYNSHPWVLINGESGWRAYPLIGGHLQTSLGDSVLLDVSYRYVPTQSKEGVGTEHRLQVGLGIKRVVLGAHLITTRFVGEGSLALDQTQLGAFAAWTL